MTDDQAQRAALWLFRAKTSRLKAEDAEYALRVWNDILDQRDQDAWIRYAKDMLADLGLITPESAPETEAGCCWAHAGNSPDLSLEAPTICTRVEQGR